MTTPLDDAMQIPLDVLPAEWWANAVAGDLADEIATRPDVRLCLPTGATPAPAHAQLPAALAARGSAPAGSPSCCSTSTWGCRPAIRRAATHLSVGNCSIGSTRPRPSSRSPATTLRAIADESGAEAAASRPARRWTTRSRRQAGWTWRSSGWARTATLVERRVITDGSGHPIEATESRYPGDRYALDVRFEVDVGLPDGVA